MKPNRNYLLVDPDKINAEKKTASGIVYEAEKSSSEPTKDATVTGVVLAMGEGVNSDMKGENRISVGDRIHYWPFTGVEVESEGKTVVIVHKKNVALVE